MEEHSQRGLSSASRPRQEGWFWRPVRSFQTPPPTPRSRRSKWWNATEVLCAVHALHSQPGRTCSRHYNARAHHRSSDDASIRSSITQPARSARPGPPDGAPRGTTALYRRITKFFHTKHFKEKCQYKFLKLKWVNKKVKFFRCRAKGSGDVQERAGRDRPIHHRLLRMI